MQIFTVQSKAEFESRAEQTVVDAIRKSIANEGSCIVGLSGGSTPGPLYEALGRHADIDWKHVTLILIDERYVPKAHKDSNRGMIERTFLADGSPARAAKFVFPDTALPLRDCVSAFDRALAGVTMDLVILGMGDDGHIASLFPPPPFSAPGKARAVHTTTNRFAVFDRVGVSMPVLKDARQRLLLITGKAKLDVLEKVKNGKAKDLPVARVCDERLTVIAR